MCADLAMLLDCFLELPIHIQQNMKHKHDQAQKKMKKWKLGVVEEKSGDDEVEIVAVCGASA